MCGLKASDVREELVSGTGREAECDFVYGEIKPPARVSLRFPAIQYYSHEKHPAISQ